MRQLAPAIPLVRHTRQVLQVLTLRQHHTQVHQRRLPQLRGQVPQFLLVIPLVRPTHLVRQVLIPRQHHTQVHQPPQILRRGQANH